MAAPTRSLLSRSFFSTIKRFLSVAPPPPVKLPSQEEQVVLQQALNKEAGQMTELVRDFLDPTEFYKAIRSQGIEFFCGVPDSLLKDFCAYVMVNAPKEKHVIAANEGSAVALASGYHLATGRIAMVYLQNSGLGNAVNPLMSLASSGVYGIPMLLLIGWRGEPGKRDEPQHQIMGHSTPGLLAALEIPFQILPDYQDGAEQTLATANQYMKTTNGPYALLVKRQTFLPYKLASIRSDPKWPLNREHAMQAVIDALHERDVVVGTTGMLSRELFEYRVTRGQGHERDFLTVGSMGHASAIAFGIAMSAPRRQVFCLDGDGAAIMHLGNLATVGQRSLPNFKHIIINNGAHDSVGGQPTEAANHDSFSFPEIALASGYQKVYTATEAEEVRALVKQIRHENGPLLLEIKTERGGRKNLGRPTRSPQQNKRDFMHFLAIH